MQGGELFIPKIPSVKICDIATAMAKSLPQEIIGIRPGEKLHETMCPADDAYHTYEFKEYFMIAPSICFYGHNNQFDRNALGEVGTRVPEGFEYNSLNNPNFLSIAQLQALNEQVLAS